MPKIITLEPNCPSRLADISEITQLPQAVRQKLEWMLQNPAFALRIVNREEMFRCLENRMFGADEINVTGVKHFSLHFIDFLAELLSYSPEDYPAEIADMVKQLTDWPQHIYALDFERSLLWHVKHKLAGKSPVEARRYVYDFVFNWHDRNIRERFADYHERERLQSGRDLTVEDQRFYDLANNKTHDVSWDDIRKLFRRLATGRYQYETRDDLYEERCAIRSPKQEEASREMRHYECVLIFDRSVTGKVGSLYGWSHMLPNQDLSKLMGVIILIKERGIADEILQGVKNRYPDVPVIDACGILRHPEISVTEDMGQMQLGVRSKLRRLFLQS